MSNESVDGEGGTKFCSADTAAIVRSIREWGAENFADYPWRGERSSWLALVTEILLQRTRAGAVALAYPALQRYFPFAESAASSSPEDIKAVLGKLGLHWRWPLVQKLGLALAGRDVPTQVADLKELPGVGPYAAAAFASLHAGIRASLLDANTVRWLCRMIDQTYDGETRRRRWVSEMMDHLTPKEGFRSFNYAILDFTMQVCAAKPHCSGCPIRVYCAYGSRVDSGNHT